MLLLEEELAAAMVGECFEAPLGRALPLVGEVATLV